MALHSDIRIDGTLYLSGPDGRRKVCIDNTQWTDAIILSDRSSWDEKLCPNSPARGLAQFSNSFPTHSQEMLCLNPHGPIVVPPLVHRRSDGAYLGGLVYTQLGWMPKLRDGSLGAAGSLDQAVLCLYTAQPDPLPWDQVVRIRDIFCLPILELQPHCWLRLEALAPGMTTTSNADWLWTSFPQLYNPILCALVRPVHPIPDNFFQYTGCIRRQGDASSVPYCIQPENGKKSTRKSYIAAIQHLVHLSLQDSSAHLRARATHQMMHAAPLIASLIEVQQTFQRHGPRISAAVPTAQLV